MAEAKRKLVAILAADVAGYSRLMGDDERATMDMLNLCRDVFRRHIAGHEGRVVDTAGDSVLAVFGSVVEATECAVAVQSDLEACNVELALKVADYAYVLDRGRVALEGDADEVRDNPDLLRLLAP